MMDREEFKSRYFGDQIKDLLDPKVPVDKESRGVSNIKKNKVGIEKVQFEKRAEGFKHKILDVVEARSHELYNKDDVSMETILNTAVKLMPKQIEGQINHSFTFADMVAKASIELEKIETIDVESNEADRIDTAVQEESD